MAHAHVMLEHRHGGLAGHGAHQRFAAARDEHVHIFLELAQRGNGLVRGDVDELHRALGQAGFGQRLAQEPGQHHVGAQGFAAAAQDDGVARLEAEDGSVHRDVGSRLVDHGHDAQRNAHPPDQQAVGPLPLGVHRAHGVGKLGHVAAGPGHIGKDGGGEAEAIHARGVHPGGFGGGKVFSVGGHDVGFAALDERGQCFQRAVLGFRAGGGHAARSFTRLPPCFAHGLEDGFAAHACGLGRFRGGRGRSPAEHIAEEAAKTACFFHKRLSLAMCRSSASIRRHALRRKSQSAQNAPHPLNRLGRNAHAAPSWAEIFCKGKASLHRRFSFDIYVKLY